MKIRIDIQNKLFLKHFKKECKIFDIGCGFGRQSLLLAKEGFEVIGIDTNQSLIDIAVEIFKKHSLKGSFYCRNLENVFTDEKFHQLILLDVIEHIPPAKRKRFIKRLHSYCYDNATLIISIPNIKSSFKDQLLNFSKYFIYPFISKYEHPYSIPSKKAIKKILGSLFDITVTEFNEETVFFICEARK
ncbi:MAG TPA: class I SAM-dependent methyltransferase [Bacteroidales bacterium]